MKRATMWVVLVLSVLLIINLGRSLYDVSRREDVVHETQARLEETRKKNEELKEELSYVKSPGYIEQQAREKLNLARPNETILVLPDVTPPPPEEPVPDVAVWQQWLTVFRLI